MNLCQFTHPALCDRPATARVVTRGPDGGVAEDRTICLTHLDIAQYVPPRYTVQVTILDSTETE